MEISDENNILLEYMFENSADQLSQSAHSVHSSPKCANFNIEFDNQIKESNKLSFFRAYASTARPSEMFCSSSIKFSKDSLILENEEIYISKEIDFKWLSDKLSSIGKIDSIMEYEDLISGYNTENFQYIMLIVKTIKMINKRLDYYLKEWFMGSGSFKTLTWNSIKLIGSQIEFSRSEIIRTFELVAINSEMEQQERMLLLIYLLKYSYEREEWEIFTEIVQFLFHLSELRRFNDAILSTLDDIHYFGTKKASDQRHSEIQYLMDVLNSEFMKTQVSPRIQILYVALLSNLLCWAKWKISSYQLDLHSEEFQPNSSKNREDTDSSPSFIKIVKEKLYCFLSEILNSEDSFIGRSHHDWSNESNNYLMIVFISLMKISDSEEEVIAIVKQYRILEMVTIK